MKWKALCQASRSGTALLQRVFDMPCPNCGNGKREKNDVMPVPSMAIVLRCCVGTDWNACATVLHS